MFEDPYLSVILQTRTNTYLPLRISFIFLFFVHRILREYVQRTNVLLYVGRWMKAIALRGNWWIFTWNKMAGHEVNGNKIEQ